MPKSRVGIIGVAPEGASSLSPSARRMVRQAELVLGGKRLIRLFPSLAGEKFVIKNNLAEVAGLIKANLGLKRMVVLASGDPNFFGIARYLTERLGRDAVDIIPNVSAMQIAFARIKESWDDAALVSVHSRPIEDIVETVRSSSKVGIFTDNRNTPNRIARLLRDNGLDNCRVYICQDLGSRKELIVSTYLTELGSMKFSPLSIMILIKDNETEASLNEQFLGIPEEKFYQREGSHLITKLEVRAVSLAKMCLNEYSTVWDIGAGSGAVSIEASLMARRGAVFAIEKNSRDVAIIRENIKRFGRSNIKVIKALAPDKLEELPDPMAVFIGGSGGNMTAILDCACRRLRPGGRIVINIATLENLGRAVNGLEANGFTVDITLLHFYLVHKIIVGVYFRPGNRSPRLQRFLLIQDKGPHFPFHID